MRCSIKSFVSSGLSKKLKVAEIISDLWGQLIVNTIECVNKNKR